jgi:hypothetical protein
MSLVKYEVQKMLEKIGKKSYTVCRAPKIKVMRFIEQTKMLPISRAFRG